MELWSPVLHKVQPRIANGMTRSLVQVNQFYLERTLGVSWIFSSEWNFEFQEVDELYVKVSHTQKLKYHCRSLVQIQRDGGGGAGSPSPLENHKAIVFLSNTGTDVL